MDIKEKDIYERLNTLKLNSSGALDSNPFASLIKRFEIRAQYEKLAAELINIIDNDETSSLARLKLLEILEISRARDIGLHIMRIAPIGKPARPKWSAVRSKTPPSLESKQINIDSRAIREFRYSEVPVQNNFFDESCSDLINLDLTATKEPAMRMIDFSKTLVLHLGFVDDTLVTALDANLEFFIYGAAYNSSNQIVQSSSFREYGFFASDLDPEKLIYGPKMRKYVKGRIISLAEEIHEAYDSLDEKQCDDYFIQFSLSLDEIIDYKNIRLAIENWASKKGYSLKDICLVIIPDESLFMLPLSFLGSSQNEPFITLLGGVSVAFSLLCFKWAVSNFHWTTCKDLSSQSPKCGIFYADETSKLDLEAEAKAVAKGFGKENCCLFGPNATLAEFHSYYTIGEICWFAGHGSWLLSELKNIDGKCMIVPSSGPRFIDSILTNWDLITSSNWNFKPIWLTVFNSCQQGKSVAFGPNPIGFMSALHSTGCISAVSAMFPIFDHVAIDFAENLSNEIKQSFGMMDFPRARALSSTIRNCLENGKKLWQLAPYALWGLP